MERCNRIVDGAPCTLSAEHRGRCMPPPRGEWPYRFWLLDDRDRSLVVTKHKTFASLYAEVRAGQAAIADERDPAARWLATGTTFAEDAQLVAGDPGKL